MPLGVVSSDILICMQASFSTPAKEHVLHLVHRTPLHVGQYMRVSVQGELNACMPEHPGHSFRLPLALVHRQTPMKKACLSSPSQTKDQTTSCIGATWLRLGWNMACIFSLSIRALRRIASHTMVGSNKRSSISAPTPARN